MWECKRYWYGAGNYGHLSYDKQHERLRELGDIEVGVGTLQATNERMAKAVNSSVDHLREWVKQQPRMHVDESPWPVLGRKEWLWVTAGRKFCRFHPGDTRSRAERVEQLGETNDCVLSTDDYSVYNGYPVKAQQKCLAHLLLSLKRFRHRFNSFHGFDSQPIPNFLNKPEALYFR